MCGAPRGRRSVEGTTKTSGTVTLRVDEKAKKGTRKSWSEKKSKEAELM